MKPRIPFLSDWLDRKAEEAKARADASRAEVWKRIEANMDAARALAEANEVARREKSQAAYEAACAENDRVCAPLLAAFPVGSRIHFLGVTMVVESVEAEWRHEEPRAVLHASWFDNDGHLDSRQFLDGDLALLQAENARGPG